MTVKPIFRVAKPGKSAFSSDVRDFLLDERYSMFKYHLNTTASVILNAGDTEASSTISHGLGYVPAFIVYYKRSDESVERILPDIPYGVDFDFYPWAYATSSGITVGYAYKEPYNRIVVPADAFYYEFFFDGVGLVVGNAGGGGKSTSVRIPSIPLNRNETINSAVLEFTRVFSGPNNGNTKYRIYGMNQDHVTGFDLGNPKTSAYNAREQSSVSGTWNFESGCVDQVREIIARSGWSYGNNMGFILNDDGSESGRYIGATNSTTAKLTITKPGSLTVQFRVIVFKDKIA